MKVFHFIPKDEIDIHDMDKDCLCEPKIITSNRLGENYAMHFCYEHQNFGIYEPNGWNDFKVLEE